MLGPVLFNILIDDLIRTIGLRVPSAQFVEFH